MKLAHSCKSVNPLQCYNLKQFLSHRNDIAGSFLKHRTVVLIIFQKSYIMFTCDRS